MTIKLIIRLLLEILVIFVSMVVNAKLLLTSPGVLTVRLANSAAPALDARSIVISHFTSGRCAVRNKRISLDAFGISKNAYDELKAFCLQYEEKKEKLQDAFSVRGINLSGMPHGTGAGNPTERAAEIALKYQADIDLIDSTARRADPEIKKYILLNATTKDNPFSELQKKGLSVPEKRFNEARRKFFYLLAVEKGIL